MIIEFSKILNLDLDDELVEGGFNATSFQVILYETSGDIRINYGPGTVPGRKFVVGIENQDGSQGLSYPGLKTDGSNEGLSVLFYQGAFTPPDPGPNPNPNPDPDLSDYDGDGFSIDDGDCDDRDSSIYPGADEICGDGKDNDCDSSTSDICPDIPEMLLYFPLVEGAEEESFVGLVNTGENSLNGTFTAYYYDIDGVLESLNKEIEIPLPKNANHKFALGDIFPDLEEHILYVTFAGAPGTAGKGYCRLAGEESAVAAAYPGVASLAASMRLNVPNITYSSGWSTEISLVNAGSKLSAEIFLANGDDEGKIFVGDSRSTIKVFVDGSSSIIIDENGQLKIVVDDDLDVICDGVVTRLGDLERPAVTSATIKLVGDGIDGKGCVGAVLYRAEAGMAAAVLSSASVNRLIAPLVPQLLTEKGWWSGLAVANPESALRTGADDECLLDISYFGENKVELKQGYPENPELGKSEHLAINVNDFSAKTYGLRVENKCGIVGLEFMGIPGGDMGCLSLSGLSRKSGDFARVQKSDENMRSRLVLLNPGGDEVWVNFYLYDRDGKTIGYNHRFPIEPYGRLDDLPEDLFYYEDVSAIATVRYSSKDELVGLVINSRSYEIDGNLKTQLDILPAIKD